MEDAAAVQKKHEDSRSAKRAQVGPTSSTSLGMKAEPPALPRRDDVLVDKSATAPKSCFSPVEMRTLTAGGDLLPTGKASTAARIIFYQLPLWFCLTEEIISRTTIQYAMDYSSFWKMKVLEAKSRQTVEFDRGGSTGRLHACLFLGTWRTLFCGEIFVWAPDCTQGWSAFWQKDDLGIPFSRETYKQLVRIAVDRCFSAARLAWMYHTVKIRWHEAM